MLNAIVEATSWPLKAYTLFSWWSVSAMGTCIGGSYSLVVPLWVRLFGSGLMWSWHSCMQEEKLPAWAKGNVVGRPGRNQSMLPMRAPHCDDAHPCYCLTYWGSPLGGLRNLELLQGGTEIARHSLRPNLIVWWMCSSPSRFILTTINMTPAM